MTKYRYLIVGGGMTAAAAVEEIREADKEGSIGLISAEKNPPYDRPPLTKDLWKGNDFDSIWRETADKQVDLHLGRKVTELDVKNKRLTDDQNNAYTYERLLLATGGTPRKLPFGDNKIIYYRTVEDYKKLRQLSKQDLRFAIIGGGFIGSEIAAALAMNDQNVMIAFPEKGINARKFPSGLSDYLNRYYRDRGVQVESGTMITGLEEDGNGITLKSDNGKEFSADVVVAGIGIQPNVEPAKAAGLDVDNGIVVDQSMRTSARDVYAAGDVANFYAPSLDRRIRVEHEDCAEDTGEVAGKNMAGSETKYEELPYFYSDLFDLGYEAVGITDSQLETYADWQEPNQKGVIYYLDDGRVRGVVLWNVWGQKDAARNLIAEPGPFKVQDLKGRIFG